MLRAPHAKWQGAPKTPSDKILQENPQDTAFEFYNAVQLNNIGTAAQANLCDWIAAEGVIYATVIETLIDAPHFIINVEGAARTDTTKTSHQGSAPKPF